MYIVCGDTYKDVDGTKIAIFGIFSDKEVAEQRKKSLEEKYQYDVWIEEMTLNENSEICIGEYIE